MPDSFRQTAIPIAAAAFASLLGLSMMVPAMPLLAKQTSSGAMAAGLMVGVFGIARLLAASPSGVMADRLGIARTAAIGLVILALASVLGVFVTAFIPLLIAIGLQGLGSSIFSTAAMTALVVKAGPQRRGRAMSWFQTSILLSFSVGPVIGGQIVDRFGPHAPFAVQAILAVLALAAVRLMPRTASGARATPSAAAPVSIWQMALLIGAIGGFAAFFSRVGVSWNIVPAAALAQFGLTSSQLGWVIGVGTAANLIAMPFLPRLIDGWGARPSFVLAAAFNVTGMLALFLLPSVLMLWIATAMIMLATGVMIPASAALSLQGVQPQATGRVMGLFRTASDGGMALGPILVPAITKLGGFSLLSGLITCTAMTILALAVVAYGSRRTGPELTTRPA
jgi:MFS transporter, DHA1 family, multidrug resistance protein